MLLGGDPELFPRHVLVWAQGSLRARADASRPEQEHQRLDVHADGERHADPKGPVHADERDVRGVEELVVASVGVEAALCVVAGVPPDFAARTNDSVLGAVDPGRLRQRSLDVLAEPLSIVRMNDSDDVFERVSGLAGGRQCLFGALEASDAIALDVPLEGDGKGGFHRKPQVSLAVMKLPFGSARSVTSSVTYEKEERPVS